MTSHRLLLSVLAALFMVDGAYATVRPIQLSRDEIRERERTQREREERDRQRRERENQGRNPRQPPPPPPPPPRNAGPPEMRIEETQHLGNGCPAGTVALVKSPDNKSLSVLFDEFVFEGGTGVRGNKKCELQIPIRITNGYYRMKILAVDLRGYVMIDEPGVRGVIRARSQLSGPLHNGRAPKPYAVERQNIMGPINDALFIRLDGDSDARITTGCTDRVTLNVSAEIALSAGRNSLPRSGLIAIDSLDQDVQGGLQYEIGWEPCY